MVVPVYRWFSDPESFDWKYHPLVLVVVVLCDRWSPYQSGHLGQVVALSEWSSATGGHLIRVVLCDRWSPYQNGPLRQVVALSEWSSGTGGRIIRVVHCDRWSPYQSGRLMIMCPFCTMDY